MKDADVKDVRTMESVPRDGGSLKEVVLQESSVMKGYLKNKKDTNAIFKAGWFLTGDVGVIHTDGYLEIKDRSKDVIISGRENINSVKVGNRALLASKGGEGGGGGNTSPALGRDTMCVQYSHKRQ
ncbi:hypothetical protein J5N97_009201 [Dioscorea zingiberensis]|uniref:AMP-dependent synthetase/ligase domain-containing protein n=1 Tax=Dioscorea zingiberensis TaxID=325984 RepID=A0A9D5CWF1_9LILI|nr:hypothetical protein J5N97_009201 [Dioscorea zingiberensis]